RAQVVPVQALLGIRHGKVWIQLVDRGDFRHARDGREFSGAGTGKSGGRVKVSGGRGGRVSRLRPGWLRRSRHKRPTTGGSVLLEWRRERERKTGAALHDAWEFGRDPDVCVAARNCGARLPGRG